MTRAAAEKAWRVLNEDIAALGTAIETIKEWDEATCKAVFGTDKAKGLENMQHALDAMIEKRTAFTLKAKAEGLL